METLKNRPDFLRAAAARRQGASGFLLQARRRAPEEGAGEGIRVGYTCSKKIGNAVVRNRAKRRLRALAREIMPGLARPGWDYVLVGRPNSTVSREFADLRRDLIETIARIHASKPSASKSAAPSSAAAKPTAPEPSAKTDASQPPLQDRAPTDSEPLGQGGASSAL